MDEQDAGRDLHEREGAHPHREEPPRHRGAQRRARGGAHRDEREEPVAVHPGVDLVRVGPELRDGGEAEDADPHEEQEAEVRDAHPAAEEEELDAADEEQDHRGQEALPGQALRDPAVERHVEDEGKACAAAA